MRRIIKLTSIIYFLYSQMIVSQLYVSTNSYVYNEGSLIYVNQDIDLQSNGNLYLRNKGQLLQGSTIINGLNKGQGNLSVFQEGTANRFGYNYWCSPVGVPVASSTGNNNFNLIGTNGVLKRPISNTAFQNPTYVSGYNGFTDNSVLQISSYWIYKYKTFANYSNWEQVGITGFVEPGLGFTMKGVDGDDTTAGIGEPTFNNRPFFNDQRYDFRGKPNDGNIEIPVLAPTVGTQYPNSTLTGNPYPSAINLNYFLLENSGYTINYSTGVSTFTGANRFINGNAYFWEHQKPATTHNLAGYIGGYGIYVPNGATANNPGTYNNAPWNTYNLDGSIAVAATPTGTNLYKRMFSPIAQGFMVQGFANGNAIMRNRYRVFVKEGTANESEFERYSLTNHSENLESQNWPDIPNVAGIDYTQFSRSEVPQIKIHTILNNLYTKEITIAFNPNTTDGFDVAMDASTTDSSLLNDTYFSIAGNNDKFLITTLPFSIYKRIPITFKSNENATFNIKVGSLINFNEAENIYLFDNVTNQYYDILHSNFEFTLPQGTYNNRFEVTFTNQTLGTNENNIKNLIVIQNNPNQQLQISNPNLEAIQNIQIYDINSKLLFDKKIDSIQNQYSLSTSTFSSGVYLVKINKKDSSNSVKIIVNNKN